MSAVPKNSKPLAQIRRWSPIIQPPTTTQLNNSDKVFFKPTELRWSASQLEQIPPVKKTQLPEVLFLGRSNVGKSSLINALLNRMRNPISRTSNKPGHTKILNAFAVGGISRLNRPAELLLVDAPGYGFKSRGEWGEMVLKYMTERPQFRRAFLLVNGQHGPKEIDYMFAKVLGDNGIPFQVVLTKCDKKCGPEALQKRLDEAQKLVEESGASGYEEIIATSTLEKGMPGVSNLRWSILNACGLKQEKVSLKKVLASFEGAKEKFQEKTDAMEFVTKEEDLEAWEEKKFAEREALEKVIEAGKAAKKEREAAAAAGLQETVGEDRIVAKAMAAKRKRDEASAAVMEEAVSKEEVSPEREVREAVLDESSGENSSPEPTVRTGGRRRPGMKRRS
ncbi:hypothetical protein SAICODRAFT_21338 [Saitoella complicata NRRL Y-17804]|uniref:uncharacterized protein n=1 Tax=Saitoella complicata (strain BCRC 22490 / CBS 7301 / JCM 7358 / NBRC 10748 / NRRL Y-17804) TaxID=698492 RepID=UPI000866C849|nr:uncharacterized protein SAICODRAFT_21338 [Saitoella complicata NRRL Y-17804]ODQ50670.1 hypothetical protein SAICODRAFT_21338 [Saitoella complicata NRRL Y-17804]